VEDAVFIPPKNRGEKLFPADFTTRNFFGSGVRRYAVTPLIVDLSPGRSDTTRFRPWSPIATRNHLDRAEKNPIFAQATGTFEVFEPLSETAGPTSRSASACPNLHE